MKPIITEITDEWIKEHQPCKEALKLWDKKERDPARILKWLVSIKKYNWVNWFIVRIMAYKDYVSYAVYAAEQVLDIFEREYPDDKIPREAIEAAKRCIENPSEENKNVAAHAVADVVAYTVAYAAYVATPVTYIAAHAAAYTAAYTAYTAAYTVAYAADVTNAGGRKMQLNILRYGIKLLGYDEEYILRA